MAELIKGKMGATVKCASMGEICHILGNEELKNKNNHKACCGKVCSIKKRTRIWPRLFILSTIVGKRK